MVAAASLLVVVLLTLLITRVATVALTLTGMSRESARFQSRSALSGVGYTTTESESVVNHPVRRRIVMVLMLLGSAGVVTVVATVILSFANTDPTQKGTRLGFIVGGLALVWVLARSAWVDRQLARLIARWLARFTTLRARDYEALLHLSGDYSVLELAVREGDWVADRTLRDLELRDEGIIVLGIVRPDGRYVGAPRFDTELRPGDTAILYGREGRLSELDGRRAGTAGDRMHAVAVDEQSSVEAHDAGADTDGGVPDPAAAGR